MKGQVHFWPSGGAYAIDALGAQARETFILILYSATPLPAAILDHFAPVEATIK